VPQDGTQASLLNFSSFAVPALAGLLFMSESYRKEEEKRPTEVGTTSKEN